MPQIAVVFKCTSEESLIQESTLRSATLATEPLFWIERTDFLGARKTLEMFPEKI